MTKVRIMPSMVLLDVRLRSDLDIISCCMLCKTFVVSILLTTLGDNNYDKMSMISRHDVNCLRFVKFPVIIRYERCKEMG